MIQVVLTPGEKYLSMAMTPVVSAAPTTKVTTVSSVTDSLKRSSWAPTGNS